MIVFLLPMIVGVTLLGCIIGLVVGRKTWGNGGGVVLAMALGVAPTLVFVVALMCLLWYFGPDSAIMIGK